MAVSLINYANSLPPRSAENTTYDLISLATDLIQHAKSNMTSNAVVVPVLQTFNVLLEADALRGLSLEEEGIKACVSFVNASRLLD